MQQLCHVGTLCFFWTLLEKLRLNHPTIPGATISLSLSLSRIHSPMQHKEDMTRNEQAPQAQFLESIQGKRSTTHTHRDTWKRKKHALHSTHAKKCVETLPDRGQTSIIIYRFRSFLGSGDASPEFLDVPACSKMVQGYQRTPHLLPTKSPVDSLGQMRQPHEAKQWAPTGGEQKQIMGDTGNILSNIAYIY